MNDEVTDLLVLAVSAEWLETGCVSAPSAVGRQYQAIIPLGASAEAAFQHQETWEPNDGTLGAGFGYQVMGALHVMWMCVMRRVDVTIASVCLVLLSVETERPSS